MTVIPVKRYMQYGAFFLLFFLSMAWKMNQANAANNEKKQLYFYTSIGDNIWVPTHLTTDSPESVDELLDWLVKTYGITGVYWRDLGFFINNSFAGKESALAYDWIQWGRHLTRDDSLTKAAIRNARKNNLQIYLHAGLFETGVQPEVGVSYNPYMIEHKIRVANPKWRSVDRWNEIRAPGSISFCYPEARKAFIKLLVNHINKLGYSGVNFYTYVENRGARYREQFGYEKPIMDKFHQRYPDVDPRKTSLNEKQKNYLAYCRGTFLTQYLKELKAELKKTGKKLSVQLNVEHPDRIGTWWNHLPFPAQGDIQADYDQWIKQGIVDNICLREGVSKDQQFLLEKLLKKYGKYNVTFTFKTNIPFLSRWNKYIKQGAIPTFKRCYSIDKYVKQPVTPHMLFSNKWLEQAQVLKDISTGKIPFKKDYLQQIIKLATSSKYVTVRREAVKTLAQSKNKDVVGILEKKLFDPQPSVRIAAARTLAKINNDSTPVKIFEALKKNNYFQFKNACIFGLRHMKKPQQVACIVKMLNSKQNAQQEVAIQAIRYLFNSCEKDKVLTLLCSTLNDPVIAPAIRYHAATSLISLRVILKENGRQQIITAFLKTINNDKAPTTVLFQALKYISALKTMMSKEQKEKLFKRLCVMFEAYGDKSVRQDKAYGWKIVGDTMLNIYPNRANHKFKEYLTQKKNKWLAWLAYRMLYVKLDQKPKLISEEEAVKLHNFAPEFPGYRFFKYKY